MTPLHRKEGLCALWNLLKSKQTGILSDRNLIQVNYADIFCIANSDVLAKLPWRVQTVVG